MTTLRLLLTPTVQQLMTELPAPLPPLQVSDIVRQIGHPLTMTAWPAKEGPTPKLADRLTRRQEQTARIVMGVVVPRLRVAMGYAAGVAGLVCAHDVPGHVKPAMISERVTIAVRAAVLAKQTDEATPPAAENDPLDELRLAQAVLDSLRRVPELLSRTAFARHYAGLDEEVWVRTGATSLLSHAPSTVCLGPDQRTSLAERPGLGGWQIGTGRSIYDRYALYRRGRSRSPSPGQRARRKPGHLDGSPHEQGRDLGATEVERAAQPYGLDQPLHRAVLIQLVYAETSSHEPTTSWTNYVADCRPAAEAATGLTEAANAQVRLWLRSQRASDLADQFGPIHTLEPLVVAAFTRRSWMELSRRERECVEAMCSCQVARTVRLVVTCGIPEGVTNWCLSTLPWPCAADAPAQTPNGLDREPDQGHDSGAAWSLAQREDATFALLLEHQTQAREIYQRAAGWQETYRRIVSQAPRTQGDYLSVSELAAYLDRRPEGES